VIVIAIEDDHEEVGVGHPCVSTRQSAEDLAAIPQPGSDVNVLVVVEEPDLGPLGDGFAFVGNGLAKIRDGRGGHPDGFIEPPVDRDRRAGPDGGRDRRLSGMRVVSGGDRHLCRWRGYRADVSFGSSFLSSYY
jgi:hypothetical protein